MEQRQTATWVVATLAGALVLAPNFANAVPEQVKNVEVVNEATSPVPVAVQNVPGVRLSGTPTVNVGNTPSVNLAGTPTVDVGNLPATQNVTGTVDVANLPATQEVTGTVNVGNLPAVQQVEVVNQQAAASLARGTLRVDIRTPTGEGPSTVVPAGVVVTDLIASISAGNRADCNLMIWDGEALLFRGLIPENRDILTIDLESGIAGPIRIGTSMGGFDDSFCAGWIMWTGRSAG